MLKVYDALPRLYLLTLLGLGYWVSPLISAANAMANLRIATNQGREHVFMYQPIQFINTTNQELRPTPNIVLCDTINSYVNALL